VYQFNIHLTLDKPLIFASIIMVYLNVVEEIDVTSSLSFL